MCHGAGNPYLLRKTTRTRTDFSVIMPGLASSNLSELKRDGMMPKPTIMYTFGSPHSVRTIVTLDDRNGERGNGIRGQ